MSDDQTIAGSIDGIPVQLLPEDSPYYLSPAVLAGIGSVGFEDTDRDLGSVSAELRDDLVAFLTRKSRHRECEDCWYSCPKSDECCNDSAYLFVDGEPKCDCGADEATALLARLTGEP